MGPGIEFLSIYSIHLPPFLSFSHSTNTTINNNYSGTKGTCGREGIRSIYRYITSYLQHPPTNLIQKQITTTHNSLTATTHSQWPNSPVPSLSSFACLSLPQPPSLPVSSAMSSAELTRLALVRKFPLEAPSEHLLPFLRRILTFNV